jgi:hypothetical protein
MGSFHRCLLLLVPIFVSTAGLVAANEDPPTPDAVASAIAGAETAIKQANAERALWTSAEDAMRKARRALQEGNAAMAVEQAHLARKQAELGIAQKSYPLFR